MTARFEEKLTGKLTLPDKMTASKRLTGKLTLSGKMTAPKRLTGKLTLPCKMNGTLGQYMNAVQHGIDVSQFMVCQTSQRLDYYVITHVE